jgi:NTP pyrophosphatase (non-canonical NTP hydrolase)
MAYLLLRRAAYSNYQNNLLPHNQFNQEEYLTKISQEIEEVAQHIRAYQAKEL